MTQHFTVHVGWASVRPPTAQHWSAVHVAADSGDQAVGAALAMVSSRPGCVMAVDAVVVDWPQGDGGSA